jgi:hypothetical protein
MKKWVALLVFPFVVACGPVNPPKKPEGTCEKIAVTSYGTALHVCRYQDAVCVVHDHGGIQCFPGKPRSPSPAPSASPGAAK